MPVKYSKLSDYNKKRILRCFSEDLTATQTSGITGINRNTVNRYYRIFRQRISDYQDNKIKGFKGEIELDESYFGGKGRGKRGRGHQRFLCLGYLREVVVFTRR